MKTLSYTEALELSVTCSFLCSLRTSSGSFLALSLLLGPGIQPTLTPTGHPCPGGQKQASRARHQSMGKDGGPSLVGGDAVLDVRLLQCLHGLHNCKQLRHVVIPEESVSIRPWPPRPLEPQSTSPTGVQLWRSSEFGPA